jgi:4-hydroxyisophthalate hydroxylase
MTAPPLYQAQIVIVGGGPVGLGLGIELGQRGVKTILVERHTAPVPIPKGQNLTQRTLEHFHFWGAERALRAARTIPRDYGIGGMTAYGTLLGEYHHDWLQRELVRPFYFTDNERLPQYATEGVLRDRLDELVAVETLYGWEVVKLSQDEEGVAVEISGRADEGRRTLRALYAVGCDGSRSLVRDEAGIDQIRSDHDRLMVLLVFRSTQLHELLQCFPGKSFYNVLNATLNGYWQFLGRVDLGTTWFFHAPVPPGTTRDNFDFRHYLHTAVGAPFDLEFEHIGFWDLRIATATTYRKGRVFIAGDSAHSHPPYGGYGINTGLEDASNLGWKLAAELSGWAGPGLLDSYDAERRPVFESIARDFIDKGISADRDFLAAFNPVRDRLAFEAALKGRASGARSEVSCFEPNYEGSPLVIGAAGAAPTAMGSHKFIARAGHHLAPCLLSSGRNIFEALGEGFTLIALDAPQPSIQEFERAAQALGIPLQVICDSRSDERARYAAELVLVRPDQFVAWAGEDGDALAVLKQAVGAVG